MTKNRIRITESDLHRIVKENVSRILKEGYFLDDTHYSGVYDGSSLLNHKKNISNYRNDGKYDPEMGSLADEMERAPGIIDDALSLLSILSRDQRSSKQIKSAIALLRNNQTTIVDAVLNAMAEHPIKNRYPQYYSSLNNSITNGETAMDRHCEDGYVENDWIRRGDNDYEY